MVPYKAPTEKGEKRKAETSEAIEGFLSWAHSDELSGDTQSHPAQGGEQEEEGYVEESASSYSRRKVATQAAAEEQPPHAPKK